MSIQTAVPTSSQNAKASPCAATKDCGSTTNTPPAEPKSKPDKHSTHKNQEQLLRFFIGLRLLDGTRQKRFLAYLSTIRKNKSQNEKTPESIGD